MKPWSNESVTWLCVVLIWGTIIGVSLAAAHTASEIKCDKRWENSGMETSHTFWGGCQVRLSSGKWVPEDRVRQSDIITEED